MNQLAQNSQVTYPVSPSPSYSANSGDSVIQIGSLEVVITIAVLLVGMGVAWGTLKASVSHLGESLRQLTARFDEFSASLAVVDSRVEVLWQDYLAPASSPRQLNETGQRTLEESGMREIAEAHRGYFLDRVRSKNPETAYDAEAALIDAAYDLPREFPELTNRIKDGAFRSGQNIDAVLFVGAIYLRDQILSELGFSSDATEEPNNKAQNPKEQGSEL